MAASKPQPVSLAGLVQFGEGEPLWVARGGKVGPLLHARIEDVTALPEPQRTELLAWLTSLDVDPDRTWPSLVITHVGAEHAVHLTVETYDGDDPVVDENTGKVVTRPMVVPIDLAAAPAWLRSPDA